MGVQLEAIKKALEGRTELSPEMKKSYEEMLVKVMIGEQSVLEASGMDPNMVEAAYDLGYKFYQAGKFEDALRFFNHLYWINPKDVRFSLGVAACHHKLGNYTDAINYYLLVSLLDKKSPLPEYYMTDCFIKADEPIGALVVLEILFEKVEYNPTFYAKIAEQAKFTANRLLRDLGIKTEGKDMVTILRAIQKDVPKFRERAAMIRKKREEAKSKHREVEKKIPARG